MFSGLVMRLLAKDPADRPQSAREVVEAIEALERGETEEEADAFPPEEAAPPPAPVTEKEEPKRNEARRSAPASVEGRSSRRPERDWGLWVLAAGAALLVVAALVLLLAALRHAG